MTHSPEKEPTRSPCVLVCEIEPESGLCRGCLRTIDEIASWISFTETQRQRVLERLELRRIERDEMQ